MFTGLVLATGELVARTPRGPGARLSVRAEIGALELGESVSVEGVCLTALAITKDGFEADVSNETLAKTTLGEIAIGARVNLERALTLASRLGGHLVSGHVDGVGTLASREAAGDTIALVFAFPRELGRYIAQKGSICVSGVSLTVNFVDDARFRVTVIPHTQEMTSLGALAVGAHVNLEVDLLARYLERLLSARADEPDVAASDAAWIDRLRRGGYM